MILWAIKTQIRVYIIHSTAYDPEFIQIKNSNQSDN